MSYAPTFTHPLPTPSITTTLNRMYLLRPSVRTIRKRKLEHPTVNKLFASAILGFALLMQPVNAAEPKLSFNRDVRPILSDTCFHCHGFDEKERKGGFRLDIRAEALKNGDSGEPIIVPGKPEASELIRRLTAEDRTEIMPPAKLGKKLTPEQIATLRTWVAQGAEYEGHWAFEPIARPTAPAVKKADWPRNDIDRFILARLEKEGLAPSPEASKETLIRRVSLDLTGLPPTPSEVDAFVNDKSADAYEKLVDRLLASPRYGERMALRWLDFARYADSNGFQVDSSRFQWPWRDWVIRAFNDNLPFDQFTIEQLAGDMLPDAAPSQVIATGFNRNTRLNGEGGLIAEEWRIETVIDRVETTGLTWLALTFNCCRCHDHKYDPISQKEFYQFFAFFNNVPESGTLQGESRNTAPVMEVLTTEMQEEKAKLETELASAQKQVEEAKKQLPQLIAAWEPAFKKQLASDDQNAWTPLEPTAVTSHGNATLTRQSDGSYLASGTNPARETYTIAAPLSEGSFTGLLLECFIDPSLPQQSLGRYPNGNFVLSHVDAQITAPGLKEPIKVNFNKAVADYSQKDWSINFVVQRTAGKGWAVDGPSKKENRKAMFLVPAPVKVPAGATLTVQLIQNALDQHNIGRFRLSTTSLPVAAVKLDGARYPVSIQQIVATPAEKRSAPQRKQLEDFFIANADSPVAAATAKVKQAQAKMDGLGKQLPTVMVMREGPPRPAHLLLRGEYDKKGEQVQAGLPAALPPLPAGQKMDRLGLARWIIDPSNPLTSRVWVNRAWEHFFGTGIVKTSENFGSQSDFPSHLALLDWLASEFMNPQVMPRVGGQPAKPWDMKAFQKLIVMSATYRQSAAVSPMHLATDPENRLLARGPRFRMSAEVIRDQALYASGLLVEKLGGPSVRPYKPQGVWDETSRYGDLRGYKHDQGDGLHRRTMYTIIKRTAPPPSMVIFDAPSREVCTIKRSRTNTPLQALALLNEITYVEAARKLGERMIREGGSTVEERITYAFRLIVSRKPSAEELSILADGLREDLSHFAKASAEATKLVAFGDAKSDAAIKPEELAAYTLTANVLLNLDEVVMRE